MPMADADHHATIAERLRAAAAALEDERICIDGLLQAHGPAAHGSLLLLMAVPCLLPIPGTGTLLGLGVAALAWTLWRGQAETSLPRRVGRLEMPRPWAQRVLALLARVYTLAGRWSRERLCPFVEPAAHRALSLLVGLMAFILILPIPMGNVLPAVALILIGLGLVFRDGLAVAAGAVVAAATAVGMGALFVGAAGLTGEWIAGWA